MPCDVLFGSSDGVVVGKDISTVVSSSTPVSAYLAM